MDLWRCWSREALGRWSRWSRQQEVGCLVLLTKTSIMHMIARESGGDALIVGVDSRRRQ